MELPVSPVAPTIATLIAPMVGLIDRVRFQLELSKRLPIKTSGKEGNLVYCITSRPG